MTSIANPKLLRIRNVGILLATFALLISAANSQPSAPGSQTVQLGAAWYPEQWPESRWEADLTLMEQAHFTVARVGEFAWARLEPTEGHFDLDWLEHAIRLAEKHHIAIVLGTPTDAPPAWLTSKYPSTRGMNADGRLREHGNRRQFSYSSPLYRRLCVDLATRLAKRFGHDPNVIGWQIGNEIADESYDPATRAQFQAFLRAKYKTLDNLNAHWTTEYWSQAYSAWSQIPLNGENGNPALMLEHRHFVTAIWQSFLHDQIAAIRSLSDNRQFITTNVGGLGWTDNWDHYKINQELDLASWDDYVGTGHLNVLRNAFMNDFVRGWKRKNFWVMETEPGTVNWSPLNNSLDPGETRALAWQTIGHGADAVLYWQWRSALNGQEQYHGSLVGPDGTPLPIYDEIQKLGADLIATSAALHDTTPKSDVALLIDYDSRWAIEFQPFNKSYDVLQVALDYYQALSSGGRSVDVISPDAPLAQYKLVVAPSLNVLPQSLANHLLDYVRNGGQLVLGPRSGMKDEFDALDPHRQPGPLAESLGGRVDQYYALESPIPVGNATAHGTASIWAERLNAISSDTHILLRYGGRDGWLFGRPAALSRTVGAGSLTYIGAILDQNLLSETLAPMLQRASAPSAIFTSPMSSDVELCRRESPEHSIFIVINHSRVSTTHLKLAAPMRNLLDANKTITSLDLQSQAVAVLEAVK